MNGSSGRLTVFLMALIVAMIVLPGCGGGGEGGSSEVSSPSGSITSLEWDPPETFGDRTPINPVRDIEYYEFFLRTDENFADSDLPMAQVSAANDVFGPNGILHSRSPTAEFTLENLLPFVERGKRYYVTIKAVGIDGLKSGFMDPVIWDVS
ncbi:MAG: hypothetical protein HKM86_08640 [Deltaproteobacteria bacterium]|nr:hypothetical protein [Deltaproteobacteria bacterium]